MKSYNVELFIIYVLLASGVGNVYEEIDYFDSDGIPFIPFNRIKPYLLEHRTNANLNVNNTIRVNTAFLYNSEKNVLKYTRERGTVTTTVHYNSLGGYKSHFEKVIKEASSDEGKLLLKDGIPRNNDLSYNDTVERNTAEALKPKNKHSFPKFFDSLLSLLSYINPNLLGSLEKNARQHTYTKRNSMTFGENVNNGTIRSFFCDCEYCKTGVPNMALLIVSGKKLKFNDSYHRMKFSSDGLIENNSSNKPHSSRLRYQIKRTDRTNFIRNFIADFSSPRDDEQILKYRSRKPAHDAISPIERKSEFNLTTYKPEMSHMTGNSSDNPERVDSSTFSYNGTDSCQKFTNQNHGITGSDVLMSFLNNTEPVLVRSKNHSNNNSEQFSISDQNKGNTKQLLISYITTRKDLIANRPEGRSTVSIESDSRIFPSNDSTVNPFQQQGTSRKVLNSNAYTESNENYLNDNFDLSSIIGDAENDEKIMRS